MPSILSNSTCDFLKHTEAQYQLNSSALTHAPFLTQSEALKNIFHEHFSQFSHLLPEDLDQFTQKNAQDMPVSIKPLSQCPVNGEANHTQFAVGGPAALLYAVENVQAGKKVVYLNNSQRWPVANGSAWHLETDATSQLFALYYNPLKFIARQVIHTLFYHTDYEKLVNTGIFTWQTLDWVSWLKHPAQWLNGFDVAMGFQLRMLTGSQTRDRVKAAIAARCKNHESYYDTLNQKLGGKLLLPGNGSLIVARDAAELRNLEYAQASIAQENRVLKRLSADDVHATYGFTPNGIAYGAKLHDRVLSANYHSLLTEYLKAHGARVIDGTLLTLYIDDKHSGGIAEYQTPEHEKQYIPFDQSLISLGNQKITDLSHKANFSLVGITGVSFLALIFAPDSYNLPLVTVCGGTNHVTRLTPDGISLTYQGRRQKVYLVRMTAGACVTPLHQGISNSRYDSTFGVGLLSSARITFGRECVIEPLLTYGCVRPVSKFGQTQFIQPYKGVTIQFGAGGGGLSRAPEFQDFIASAT